MTLPIPESLCSPRAGDANNRKAVDSAIATTAAPTGSTPGIHTRNHKYLHATVDVTGGGSGSVTLWGKSDTSDVWAIMTWIGSSGVIAVTSGSPVMIEPALLAGIDRVHPQVSARVAPAVIDAWLSGSSF